MGIDDSKRPRTTDSPATETPATDSPATDSPATETHATKPHAPQPCPRCGLTDRVRSVPAVHLEGRSRITGGFHAADGYPRTMATGLSDALAPSPEPFMPTGARMLAWLTVTAVVGLGAFTTGAVGGGWFDSQAPRAAYPDTSAFGWITVLAVCICLGLLFTAVGQVSARRDIAADRTKALPLWSLAWYCTRCGTVHVPGSAALSLQEFRTMVWKAGGYDELAAEYPVL